MLKNYFTITFRGFARHKAYFLITLAGLLVGMASCLLILYFVAYEVGYDQFHANGSRIYRVQNDTYENNVLATRSAMTFPAMGPAMKQDVPAVREYTRLHAAHGLMRYNDVKFFEERVYYADPALLTMFTFPLVNGSATAALSEPYSLVLTETMARKYFGAASPIGKQVVFADQTFQQAYTVTGVLGDVPANSHLKFDFLLSYNSLVKLVKSLNMEAQGADAEKSWVWPMFYTYVLLDERADPRKVETQLAAFTRTRATNGYSKSKFLLQPLAGIHLHSNLSYELETNGSINNVYALVVIAGFILIIAWVNYVNLSTARSLERAKEVGIRKVMGAERGQLVKQYILESVFLSALAALLSVILFLVALPFFKPFLGSDAPGAFAVLGHPGYWLGILLVFLAGSVLAGLYPAFVLSSFQPIEVLKNKIIERNDRFSFRKALVVFQFSVSYILITATIVIYYQINYMQSQDLGFSIERTAVIKSPNVGQNGPGGSAEALRNEIMQLPGVKSVSISTSIPGKPYSQGAPDVRRVGSDPKQGKFYNIIGVDYDFIAHYKMRMVAGRNFSRSFGTDSTGVIINEVAAAQLGFRSPKEALHKKIHFWGIEAEVLGVIRNYHHESLKSAYSPIIFSMLPQSDYTFYSVKLAPGNSNQVVSGIKQHWSRIFPDKAYEYFFLDQFFNEQYRADNQIGGMFTFFSVLAIVVASMGLFGFSSYMNRKRLKEIGIRRVLGATALSNFVLLCAASVRLVLIAVVIASPLTFYLLHRWLQNFPFAAKQNAGLYTVAAILLMCISLLTIAYQAFRAAHVNPVKTLKSE